MARSRDDALLAAVQTPCPFTRGIHVVSAALAEVGVCGAAQALLDFARDARLHTTTVFIAYTSPRRAGTPRELARIFGRLVQIAGWSADGAGAGPPIQSSTWRLKIADSAFFALALSSLYAPTHTRYTPLGDVLLFQPEALFSAQGITSGPHRLALTTLAEARFAACGRPFKSLHEAQVPKSLRIVLDDTYRGVKWWPES